MVKWLNTDQFAFIVKLMIGLVLFFLPWQTVWIYQERFLNGSKWQYGTLQFYGTEGLFWIAAILFIAWFVGKWKMEISKFKNEFHWTKDRVFVGASLLFIIYNLLSQFWAMDRGVATQQSLRVIEAFLLFFMLYLGPLHFRQAVFWFVAGSIIPSILGIAQFLLQTTWDLKWLGLTYHPVWEVGTSVVQGEIGRWLRAYGPFSHPNVFGGYLVTALVFTLGLFYSRKIGVIDKKIRDKRYEIGLVTVILFQVSALFFTFSRSAWIAFGIVALLHCYIIIKNKKFNYQPFTIYYLLPILIFLTLTITYFPLVQIRWLHTSDSEISSTEERWRGYREALTLFKQHPWLGVGVGNYTAALYALNPARFGWEYQPVHNVPLLVAVELGIVGTGLLILVVITFFIYYITRSPYHARNIYHNTNIYNNDFSKDVGYGGLRVRCYLLSVTGYVILVAFDHYLFSSYSGLLLTSLLGYAAAKSPIENTVHS